MPQSADEPAAISGPEGTFGRNFKSSILEIPLGRAIDCSLQDYEFLLVGMAAVAYNAYK
jgi:hypothetical protein